MFDEDVLSADDLVSTILLDLATLDMDSKLHRVFSLNPKVRLFRPELNYCHLNCYEKDFVFQTEDTLEMEFELSNR